MNEEHIRLHERMDWEELSDLLGDLYAHYHTSKCYSRRHEYSEAQRELMFVLSDTIDACKKATEVEIVKLLVGVTDE